jgi:hypothetical protein
MNLKYIIFAFFFIVITVLASSSFAEAGMRSYSRAQERSYSSYSTSSNMHVDLVMQFLRGTKPEDSSDNLVKLNLGGMFASWIGLDVFGLSAVKAKDSMIGTNFVLKPVDWFFLKAGGGAYTEKQTRKLILTPVYGTGVQATLFDNVFAVSEFNYFELGSRKNLSFGMGLGVYF